MDYQLKSPLLPLQSKYNTVERVFAIRGVNPENIQHYLNTTEQDILNPKLIDRIDDGCKMLARHIFNKDKIFIQVDSDCDGFTSAACLINYLNCIFPSYVQNNIDYRIHTGKQHGILKEIVPSIIANDYKLVIAPDSSSNDYEQHQILRENGIDVLVIDHHEAEKISENACIINNQLCSYPTKSLSGVGMVYKFCCRFDEIMETTYADNFRDLVALGLIGDMMDVRDFETKHLIASGLKNVRNPFFKKMVEVQNFSISRAGGLCPFAIGFYIAPQINGTIRMGTIEEKTLLFESMLDFKAYDQIPSTKRGCKGQFETRVDQACRNCVNIKRNQDKSTDNNVALVENIIKEKNLEQNKIIAVKLAAEDTNRNLTGLIANKLMAKYKHPFLLLVKCKNKNGDISWEGSGRSFDTSTFSDLRTFIRDSGYASLAEGHPNAFGVAFPDENFNAFINYSNQALENCNFTPCTKVDFIWSANTFSKQDIIDLAALKTLWGQELEEPKIAVENIKVTSQNITLLGRDKNCPTLKITLPNGVTLIRFKTTEEEYEELIPQFESGSITINIIGTCMINEWNGTITPQIEIKDYEIVGEDRYYF